MLIKLVLTLLDSVRHLISTTDDRCGTATPANANSTNTIKNLLRALNCWSPKATKKAFSSTSDAGSSLLQLLNKFSVEIRRWVFVAKRFRRCGGLISKGQSIGRLTLDKGAFYAVENLVNKLAVTERNIAEERSTSTLPRWEHNSQVPCSYRVHSCNVITWTQQWTLSRVDSIFFQHANPHSLMSILILSPSLQIKSAYPTLPLPKILR